MSDAGKAPSLLRHKILQRKKDPTSQSVKSPMMMTTMMTTTMMMYEGDDNDSNDDDEDDGDYGRILRVIAIA